MSATYSLLRARILASCYSEILRFKWIFFHLFFIFFNFLPDPSSPGRKAPSNRGSIPRLAFQNSSKSECDLRTPSFFKLCSSWMIWSRAENIVVQERFEVFEIVGREGFFYRLCACALLIRRSANIMSLHASEEKDTERRYHFRFQSHSQCWLDKEKNDTFL